MVPKVNQSSLTFAHRSLLSRLVERFLLGDYEARTSSTHALTMFRYNYTINDKTYKVGKWQLLITPWERFVDRFGHTNCLMTDWHTSWFLVSRYLGHSRLGVIQWVAPDILLWRTCLPDGVRCGTPCNLWQFEELVCRDAQYVSAHSVHGRCKQSRHGIASHYSPIQICRRD